MAGFVMPSSVQEFYQTLVARAEEAFAAREEGKKIVIQVGSATCEHAAGSREVLDEFRKHIISSGRKDIVLRQTGCTGRCSREPIVGVFIPGRMPVKYERVDRELVHDIFVQHVQGGAPITEHVLDAEQNKVSEYEFLFCDSSRCGWQGGLRIKDVFTEKLRAAGVDMERVKVSLASCFGACGKELAGTCSHVLVRPLKILYRVKSEADLDEIVQKQVLKGKIVEQLRVGDEPVSQEFFDVYGDVAFFNRQSRVALRNNGVVDPESFDEFIHYKGFKALATVLERGDPQWVIDEVTKARLRGRGGGGFPTGAKWTSATKNEEKIRYIICNADEGDPGAFMDRSMLESDPFNAIEGMIIGGFAVGAQRGFIYIRAEYPLAIRRIQHAMELCHKYGILGENIMNSGFAFDIEIRLGAGAFVCGEETALIRSIEGERGQPRIRPPYPSQSGLWGNPTVINNAETFANIAAIINYGGEWFNRLGTEKSGGTKVFALAGKVRHTGLVEVPLGTTLREIVYDIGGGVPKDKKLKAIQTGGPAGGCIPAKWADLAVDFDTLTQAGSIMGSGGMIVLDEDDCMVDIAKFYLSFSQDESCGKCTPCREGTTRILEILEKITGGDGTVEDLDRLERLAKLVNRSSLCGLGRAAPNPVLSTLKHFRAEYLAHVVDKRCPSKRCKALLHYEIDAEKCIGCTVCARNCPAECIAGARKTAHVIDAAKCVKCGRCFEVCRFDAVIRT